jgi:hypothetical protein
MVVLAVKAKLPVLCDTSTGCGIRFKDVFWAFRLRKAKLSTEKRTFFIERKKSLVELNLAEVELYYNINVGRFSFQVFLKNYFSI